VNATVIQSFHLVPPEAASHPSPWLTDASGQNDYY